MAPDPPAAITGIRYKKRFKYPLLYIPASYIPIDEKIALMKQAIEAGDNVNQLDPTPDRRYSRGRPLNVAVDSDILSPAHLKENIPVVKFLLEHGADPRLPGGALSSGSAIDDMRDYSSFKGDYWNDLKPFFTEALALMEEAARKLDEQDARRARWHAFFNRFKFWETAEE
ncbi:hypothetical protein B7463_g88, partial [Scytalidium lignicola]